MEISGKSIQVLLATYNGAEFLEEFLLSLLRQELVTIHLLVSDDGSTDESLNLLKKYKNEFASFNLLRGPGLGPKQNFEFLISKCDGPFIALADQDDIWHPNHLINSINRINHLSPVPALSFSAVTEFYNEKRGEKVWPNEINIDHFENIFLENLARGCTVVMNYELVQIVRRTSLNAAIMHDWWLLLIARSCGVVKYSELPEIRYRQHGGNFIGTRKGKLTRAREFLYVLRNERSWLPAEQLKSLEIQAGIFMRPTEREYLTQFNKAYSSGFNFRLKYFLLNSHNFRTNRIENLLLKLYLALT